MRTPCKYLTAIRISTDTWQWIEQQKQGAESNNQTLNRLLKEQMIADRFEKRARERKDAG